VHRISADFCRIRGLREHGGPGDYGTSAWTYNTEQYEQAASDALWNRYSWDSLSPGTSKLHGFSGQLRCLESDYEAAAFSAKLQGVMSKKILERNRDANF